LFKIRSFCDGELRAHSDNALSVIQAGTETRWDFNKLQIKKRPLQWSGQATVISLMREITIRMMSLDVNFSAISNADMQTIVILTNEINSDSHLF